METIKLENSVLELKLGDIIQQFTEEDLQKQMPIFMQDIDADTKPLIDTYQNYLASGNFSEAELFRNSHPELETRIWDSFKANAFMAYASFIYLYSKNQKQQCIISEVPPTEGNGEEIIGQVEGDIWFRIDGIKDGVINTTPFQKQEDGTYKEFAVAPKLEFATQEDIDEVYDNNIEELSHPESLIDNENLKYFKNKVSQEITDKNTELNDEISKKIEDINLDLDRCFQSASSGKVSLRDAIIAAGGTVKNTSGTDYPSYADLTAALKGIKFLITGKAYTIYPSDSSGITGGWSGSQPTMQNRVAFDATPFKSVTFSIYLSHGSSIYHYTEIAVSVLSDTGSVLTSTAKRITDSKLSGAYTLTLSLGSINRKIFIRTQYSNDSNYNDCSGSVNSIVLST